MHRFFKSLIFFTVSSLFSFSVVFTPFGIKLVGFLLNGCGYRVTGLQGKFMTGFSFAYFGDMSDQRRVEIRDFSLRYEDLLSIAVTKTLEIREIKIGSIEFEEAKLEKPSVEPLRSTLLQGPPSLRGLKLGGSPMLQRIRIGKLSIGKIAVAPALDADIPSIGPIEAKDLEIFSQGWQAAELSVEGEALKLRWNPEEKKLALEVFVPARVFSDARQPVSASFENIY